MKAAPKLPIDEHKEFQRVNVGLLKKSSRKSVEQQGNRRDDVHVVDHPVPSSRRDPRIEELGESWVAHSRAAKVDHSHFSLHNYKYRFSITPFRENDCINGLFI